MDVAVCSSTKFWAERFWTNRDTNNASTTSLHHVIWPDNEQAVILNLEIIPKPRSNKKSSTTPVQEPFRWLQISIAVDRIWVVSIQCLQDLNLTLEGSLSLSNENSVSLTDPLEHLSSFRLFFVILYHVGELKRWLQLVPAIKLRHYYKQVERAIREALSIGGQFSLDSCIPPRSSTFWLLFSDVSNWCLNET